MFITEEDYIQVGPDALKIMQQSSTDNRKTAEQRAMSRIAAALRARYDVDATFAREGEERDAELVGCATDIALYHMVCSLPGKMGNGGSDFAHETIAPFTRLQARLNKYAGAVEMDMNLNTIVTAHVNSTLRAR